jgi:hypothetical protein
MSRAWLVPAAVLIGTGHGGWLSLPVMVVAADHGIDLLLVL